MGSNALFLGPLEEEAGEEEVEPGVEMRDWRGARMLRPATLSLACKQSLSIEAQTSSSAPALIETSTKSSVISALDSSSKNNQPESNSYSSATFEWTLPPASAARGRVNGVIDASKKLSANMSKDVNPSASALFCKFMVESGPWMSQRTFTYDMQTDFVTGTVI